jgi:hypothetical protein
MTGRVAFLIVLMTCGMSRGSNAQTRSSSEVIVRSYNTIGVSPKTASKAQLTATAILSEAGIDANWRECRTTDGPMSRSTDACDGVLIARELMVRIVAVPRTITDREVLGYSHVDPQLRRGTLATVFADRIRELAAQLRMDEGELLGRAMAHEIGHLLLGTLSHSEAGLMRGHWSTTGRKANWLFSSVEAVEMQDGLTARDGGDVLAMMHAR